MRVLRNVLQKLFGRVVFAAQNQQHWAAEFRPSQGHAGLKGLAVMRLCSCTLTRKSSLDVAYQATCRAGGHLPAEQLDPELFLPQPLGVVVLDLRFSQAGF